MLLYPSSRPIEERFGNYWKGREIDEMNSALVGLSVLSSNFINVKLILVNI